MKADPLPLCRMLDPAERFRRVRGLMLQWQNAATRERLAKATCGVSGDNDEVAETPLTTKEIELLDGLARQTRACEIIFLAASEEYFMMGRV